MKYVLIIVVALFVLMTFSSKTPEIRAQSSSGNDCDDLNASINPGVSERGALCANGIDDDCDLLIDCQDDSCAGSVGPNLPEPRICCIQASDCGNFSAGAGTCGDLSCTANECSVVETPSLCTGTTQGDCGEPLGTCTGASNATDTGVPFNTYQCDFTGDNSKCPSCDDYCRGPDHHCIGIPTLLCELNYTKCIDATNDPYQEPTESGQCICHGTFETCGGP